MPNNSSNLLSRQNGFLTIKSHKSIIIKYLKPNKRINSDALTRGMGKSCSKDNFLRAFRYIFQNGKLIEIKEEELSRFKEQILYNSITDFGIDIKPIFKYPSDLNLGEYVDDYSSK